MKKQIIVLSCVAAVAIATFVGKKAYEPSLNESSDLFMQNVEALTQGETCGGYNPIYYPCKTRDGEGLSCGRWRMDGKQPFCSDTDC